MNAPVWSIAPDWSDGVTERLEWLTDVHSSPRGAEQRRQRRLAPRCTLDFSVLADRRDSALMDLSTFSAGGARWWMPLWHEVTWFDGAPAGADTISLDTRDLSLLPGGHAVLLGETPFEFEVVAIQSVTADAIHLVQPLKRHFGPGSRLYPVCQALLAQQPQITRLTDQLVGGKIRAQLTESFDWPALAVDQTYRGHPVLRSRPEASEDLTFEYQRLLLEIDNGRGVPWRHDTAFVGFSAQKHNIRCHGRAEHADLKSLLYYLRGRLKPVWVPTWSDDLELARSCSANALDIHYCGYSRHALLGLGRRDLRIELVGGQVLYRRIKGAADMLDGTERLMLDTPLPQPITQDDVLLISWMALSRLDHDAVEIQHTTDVDGLTTCSLTFRSVFDEHRSGLGYDLGQQLGTARPWPPGTGMGQLLGESVGGVDIWPRVNGRPL